MRRSFRAFLFCAATLGAASALPAANDPPTGYYMTASGLTGSSLKAALHARIQGHSSISYAAVWDALRVLDADPANPDNVILLYSGESRDNSLQDEGDETENWWNREHLWPLSFGPGTTATVAGRDLFHLFACDKNVNAARANMPFDSVTFTPHPEAPSSGYNSAKTWWHPRDADKGPIARSLFYMAVRYEAGDHMDLELGETTGAARMAKLSTLLAWHRAFPPTEAERVRNHRIYTSYQGNRNPFIDNPLFVDQVFSGDTPFGAWRRQFFTTAELSTAALVSDASDPDGDGLPNRLEFAFNLDPKAHDSATDARPTVEWLAPVGVGGSPRVAVTHRRHRYATDLVFYYDVSTDLAEWTATTPLAMATTYVDGLTDRVRVEFAATGERRFVRVRVERP